MPGCSGSSEGKPATNKLYCWVFSVYCRCSWCTIGVLSVYCRRTVGVLPVYCQCTVGVLSVYSRCIVGVLSIVPSVYCHCTVGVVSVPVGSVSSSVSNPRKTFPQVHRAVRASRRPDSPNQTANTSSTDAQSARRP